MTIFFGGRDCEQRVIGETDITNELIITAIPVRNVDLIEFKGLIAMVFRLKHRHGPR
jgi:hypothetical protein